MVHKEKVETLVLVIEQEGVPWYCDIMKFLELRVYLDGTEKRERRSIRMVVMQYILYGGQIYRRFYDGIYLHCLKKEEVEKFMEKIH